MIITFQSQKGLDAFQEAYQDWDAKEIQATGDGDQYRLIVSFSVPEKTMPLDKAYWDQFRITAIEGV